MSIILKIRFFSEIELHSQRKIKIIIMKKFSVLLTLIFTITACQQQKIAYIDTGEVVNEYQEKKDVEELFKGKKEQLDKKNDSISKAFQLEVQEFQVKSKRMSQKKGQEMYQELGQKQQLLQQQIQFSEQQLGQTFNAEIDSVIMKVKKFTKDYGKKNGYTFIIGTSDATSTVLHGDETLDLTTTILEALNAEYKK